MNNAKVLVSFLGQSLTRFRKAVISFFTFSFALPEPLVLRLVRMTISKRIACA